MPFALGLERGKEEKEEERKQTDLLCSADGSFLLVLLLLQVHEKSFLSKTQTSLPLSLSEQRQVDHGWLLMLSRLAIRPGVAFLSYSLGWQL